MAFGFMQALFPELSREMTKLLSAIDRPKLADQIETLEVIDKCRCGDYFCSSFYTAAKPDGAWGPNHENVVLRPSEGMLILDVVDDRISYVEVLDRPDFKTLLDKVVP